jgi:uncharacterized protein (TIGR02145 family)
MKTKAKTLIIPCIIMGLSFMLAYSCKKDDTAPPVDTTVKDYDNNVYHTIKIGTQTWMVENLRTTHYNDGGNIENLSDNTAWHDNTTGAYCWYNNDATNGKTYGALYNWYAVNSGKLCPPGWKVPSDADWTKLTDNLGGASIAGGKLKEIGSSHWNMPNAGADNSSGFTALPGGFRHSGTGEFQSMNKIGNWWSTKSSGTDALTWYMSCNTAVANSYTSLFDVGSSVRCIKVTE